MQSANELGLAPTKAQRRMRQVALRPPRAAGRRVASPLSEGRFPRLAAGAMPHRRQTAFRPWCRPCPPVASGPFLPFAQVNFRCGAATRTGHSLLGQKVQSSGGQGHRTDPSFSHTAIRRKPSQLQVENSGVRLNSHFWNSTARSSSYFILAGVSAPLSKDV